MKHLNVILAQQQLDAVDAGYWKSFCICLLVVIGVALALVSIWAMTRKPEPTKLQDNPAIQVEKRPKRYNHDQIDTRFKQVESRLTGVEAEQDAYWDQLQAMEKERANQHLQNSNRLVRIMERLGIRE